MTLEERIAWLHRDAVTLQTPDRVELKFALKKLIADATELLELVRAEILAERHNQKKQGGAI